MPLGRASTGSEVGLTISDTVITLTVPGDATRAIIAVETAGIRYRDDGSDPTSSNGIPLSQGSYLVLTNINEDYHHQLTKLRFIKSGASDATLNIMYYR